MFKKIIEKMRVGSCKTNTTDNVNAVKESEKKQEGNTKWNTIVPNVVFNGKEHHILLIRFENMKKFICQKMKTRLVVAIYESARTSIVSIRNKIQEFKMKLDLFYTLI